jgi:hypothetical protein
MPNPVTGLVSQIDTTHKAPLTLAIGVVSDQTGSADLHALVVGYNLASTSTNTPLTLGIPGAPLVAVGWAVDINTQSTRSSFTARSGTVNLACISPTGTAGTITNVLFTEDTSVSDSTPLPGGCSFMIASEDFTIGSCP